MARYDILLMDADDTLLDYPSDSKNALARTLDAYGMPSGEAVYAQYQAINQGYWEKLERGEVTREALQVERFRELFAELGREGDPAAFNRDYMRGLSEGGTCLPGARELCERLSREMDLYIITNGLSVSQYGRFNRCGLLPYLKKLYISEEVGVQKPERAFFDRVLADIGAPDPSRVLVFGDSLTSDMQGGVNAGLDTCWYAPKGGDPGALHPNYIVRNYEEFLRIVL